LGHTFGHASETDQGYGVWLHGEAVAAGMVVAAKLSELSTDYAFDSSVIASLVSFLRAFDLPVTIPDGMTFDRFMELMARDKKAEYGKIKLILLESLGKAVISSDSSPELIREALDLSR
jgi:3-dehydroquinate synthase